MAEASEAPSVALDAMVYIANAISSVQWSWYLAGILRLLALPLSLVMIPLSYVAEVLLVIFAPLLYLIGFLAASVQGFASLLVSLKPLYSFLSAAAGIGIIAGVLLGATSSVITSYLGMQDTDEDDHDRERDRDYDEYDFDYDKDQSYEFEQDAHHLDSTSYQKHLLSSGDADSGPTRRVAHGLLSQTIHEEDDSSGA